MPQAAHAQAAFRDVIRGDSYSNLLKTPPAAFADTGLVPGGILKFYLNTAGAIGCSGSAGVPDTVTDFKIQFVKSPNSVPFASIIDTVDLYVDANNNQQFDAGDVTRIARQTLPVADTGSTVDYSLIVTEPAAGRILFTGTESYVIVVYTKNNLRLNDTTIFVRIPNRGVTIVMDTAGPTVTQKPNPGQRDLDTFIFRVYSDSTGTPFIGNKFAFQDSGAAGQSPFTLLHGTLQGETRTVGGDSLAKFGVDMGGSAGANIDSAWLIVGSAVTPDVRVDLARTAGTTSWNAPNISTVILALAGGVDTFRVVVTADTPPLQGFVGCTIPVDSVGSKFRRGNATVKDSSGVVTFSRPRAALHDSSLPNIIAHPDSRAAGTPYILAVGTIQPDTLLQVRLGGDSVQRFGLRLQFGGGMSYLDVESVGVLLGATEFTADSSGALAASSGDSYLTAVINQSFGVAESYTIRITIRETAPINGTVRAIVPIDSVTFRYRSSGPSDSVVGSRLITINKPRVTIADSTLSSIAVHSDTRITDSFLLMAGTINTDTLFTPSIASDSLRGFTFRLVFTGGVTTAHISETTSQIVIGNTVWTPKRGAGDTYYIEAPGLDSSFSLNTYESFRIYIRTESSAPINGTIRAQILQDSVTTRYRVAGPDSSLLGSRTVTINRPRVTVADSILTNIAVHPDTRVTDSFLIMAGTINADTLLTPILPRDSLTAFTFRLVFTGGVGTQHISETTSQIVIGNTVWTPKRGAGDTYYIEAPGLDSAFSLNTYESYRIYIRTESSTPVNGTIRAQILQDSITTRYRVAGPDSSLLGSRTVTINKPKLTVADSALSNIAVHPDTRVTDSFLILAGTINADTLLTPILANDSLTGFTFRLIFTGGVSTANISETTSQIVIGNTIWTPKRGAGDTYYIEAPGLDSGFSFNTYESYRVYIRTESSTPVNGTIRAQILQDSVSSRFRVAGPDSSLLGSRTVTINKPRVEIADSTLGNVTVHPDTRVTDSVLVMAGTINRDTLLTPSLPSDSLTGFTFRLIFTGGMTTAHVKETVSQIVIGNTIWTPKRGAGDTYYIEAPGLDSAFSQSTYESFRIYIRTESSVPNLATLRAQILQDSVTTRYRVAGPDSSLLASRTVTYRKPRVIVVDSAMPSIGIHPDTRIQNDSIFLASFFVAADTLLTTPLPYDTITRLQTRLILGGGLVSATHIDTVIFVVDNTPYVTSSRTGDTFGILPNQTVSNTTTVRVYVRTFNLAPVNGTIQGQILVDSIAAAFRDTGPAQDMLLSRVVTIVKPRIALTDSVLPAITVHADSRVQGDSVQLAEFFINADTLLTPALPYDTIARVNVRLVFAGPRMDSRYVDTVTLVLNGTSYPPGTILGDTYLYLVNQTITGTTTVRLYARTFDTANGSIQAQVQLDSFASAFRESGPSSVFTVARIVTVVQPRIAITDSPLERRFVHADSRVSDSILILAGTINADTLISNGVLGQVGALSSDSLTSFAVRLKFSPGINATFVDETNSLIQIGNTGIRPFKGGDSLYITNVDSLFALGSYETYRVYVRLLNTAPRNETIQAVIQADSITTRRRVAGNANEVASAIDSIVRSQVIVSCTTLPANIGHPDSRVLFGANPWSLTRDSYLVVAGYIHDDTISGINRDTLSQFGFRVVYTGGISAVDVESVALVIDGIETAAMTANGNFFRATFNGTTLKQTQDTINFRAYISF
ncbi:MAG: hypothetical protein AAB229_06045, partial [Candidatus Hydrogenedentota bacterium]